MKKYSLKITAVILTALALTLILTSCGSKTNAKVPKVNKVKKAQSINKPSADATENQTEQQKFTSKLSVTDTEMNDVVNEIDAALKDIDQIDSNQDKVPNL